MLAVRLYENNYFIIDGLKRYYAALELGIDYLDCRIFDVSEQQAIVMILNHNRHNKSLSDYEEGLIIRGLVKDHGLSQKEVAVLFNNSRSWVCRRLSLTEKLSENAGDQLRLGTINSSHARELIKLPRGNQASALECIVSHSLSCAQSKVLIDKYLKSNNEEEQKYIFTNPHDVLSSDIKKDVYDCRLSAHGNNILRGIEHYKHSSNILSSSIKSFHTKQLSEIEQQILMPFLKVSLQLSLNLFNQLKELEK